jgi:copper homeostasis protein
MPQSNDFTLEVCVESAAGLLTCEGRADRIELCSALGLGGLTPGPGLIRRAQSYTVPVHVLIRPRPGDFTYDRHDLAAAIADIRFVRECGLAGVVIGAARDDRLDLPAMRNMIDAAEGLHVTLHRVADILPDPLLVLDQAVVLGGGRILTAGGAQGAADGTAQLAKMQDAAADQIEIMAGSGVTAANVAQIAEATGIRAFPASCTSVVAENGGLAAFGFGAQLATDKDKIEALRAKLHTLSPN